MTRICIPTIKTYDKVKDQVAEIRPTIGPDVKIHVVSHDQSAAANRNACLDLCNIGDTVVMIDDDITGFTPGWVDELTRELKDDVIMTAARLLQRNGEIGPMKGAEDRNGLEWYDSVTGDVPSAAIAFIYDGIRFDENFGGAGWEDTDFCRAKKQKYPGGRIIITNRCRLVHLLEFKHMGADTDNAKYYAKKWHNYNSLDCVIFSKNRAAQLDTLLSSIKEFVPEIHNLIHVIYTHDDDKYRIGYDKVKARFPQVKFHEQYSFDKCFKNVVNTFSTKYCLMLVDDGVFIRRPNIGGLLENFDNDVCTASLRLNPEITFCTPAHGAQMIKPQLEERGNVYRWDYTKMERHMDWGYPHGVDGNIYRTKDLQNIINADRFEANHPNELEVRLITRAPNDKPYMLCDKETSWVLISANMVADNCTPHGDQSVEQLNDEYRLGALLDHNLRGKEKLMACNIIMPYIITKPTIGVHFQYNGIMTGCYKVWDNTLKGLDIAGLPHSKSIERYNGAINTFNGMPKNTVVGPETMVLPRENYDLWRKYKTHAVPCDWVKDSYLKDEGTHDNKIVVWPVGIDTEKFNCDGAAEKGSCLIFGKHVNLPKQEMERRISEAEKAVKERGYKPTTIVYGQYLQDELIQAARKAEFAIWISGTESQNIALLEVLSIGTPVYVWLQDSQEYGGETMTGLSNAPYFDARCGMIVNGLSLLDGFIKECENNEYNPREYILDNFRIEDRARQYYNIVTGSI